MHYWFLFTISLDSLALIFKLKKIWVIIMDSLSSFDFEIKKENIFL